jgi:hypothetical protein
MKRFVVALVAVATVAAIVLIARTRSAAQDRDAFIAEARKKAEAYRGATVRINELAGNIHSEQDARAYVDELARMFGDEITYALTAPLRARVAQAEFVTATDASKLIPEQRVADAWNKWVADINAPAEARITAAEVHNYRDAMHASGERMWQQYPNLWSAPNIAAVKPDGTVAEGCRAVEALFVLHQIDTFFTNLLAARDRVAKGVLLSEELRKRRAEPQPKRQLKAVSARIEVMPATATQVALHKAEAAYIEKHGETGTAMRVLQLVSEVLGD